ncbi:hypothetical protein DRQ18_03240 [bacterium]|nr:MAG: hypothetical protein DRQ18_03240 [bacterium]
MVIFLLLASSGIVQSPGSEIGDAVFRELPILDLHAAIYRCSKSTGYGIPDSVDIIQAFSDTGIRIWESHRTF